LMIMSRHD